MNIHRINWIWGNKAAMEGVGVHRAAQDLGRLQRRLRQGRGRRQGLPRAPLALTGPTPPPSKTIVYGQDIDLFTKAFVDGDVDALRSEGMIKAFDQMRLMVTKYMDPAIAGRDYDTASNMMVNGDALFFIMGDWELGTIKSVGKEPGADILCGSPRLTRWQAGLHPELGLGGRSSSRTTRTSSEGQKLLAHEILSPEFQTIFNISKGSIPARLDVDLTQGFNVCQQDSRRLPSRPRSKAARWSARWPTT